MTNHESPHATPPRPRSDGAAVDIGAYHVERELSAGQSFLAEEPGGKRVVLKKLDEDCLLRGQLHPDIHDRLGRVRELAHVKVANLHSVERVGASAYLVWEYIEGQTLEAYAAGRAPAELLRIYRELVLAVEDLHALGIVHGSIHGRNVIVTGRGEIRLTHVSPLLYYDPKDDVAALGKLLQQEAPASLAQLRARLALSENGAGLPESPGPPRREVRHRAWLAAAALTVMGVGLAHGVWRWVENRSPRPSAPPEAPSAALQPASRGV